jgi:hypothetical protein
MPKDNIPRISVNKLAEYIGSKGGRQRQILRDQKFPEDFKGMYYREATEAISRCIASNMEDTSPLYAALKILNQANPDKIGTARRINSNIDAIESFEAMMDSIDLFGADAELGEHRPDKLTIAGVDVSIRPEIVLRGKGKGGKSLIGGMKLHFSKTFSLDEDAAGYVSALLQRYSEDKLVEHGEMVATNYCAIVDVGSKTVYPGVKSIAQRMKDITAECRNISGLWPTIKLDE